MSQEHSCRRRFSSPRAVEQPELIEAWLSEMRGNKVTIRMPSRGQGARLMALAMKNAHDSLMREKQRDTIKKAVEHIAARLHLAEAPKHIEGYDISNISEANP